ncbi:M20/M25/M40 family metallo-hydrolase [Microbulbifer hydrolyticus]|uniref:Acetylornithine deacetylase/succinyl-diaminopimelate desuccinylase-like protein n=1 Tax=Microbulbifer hydrolyticus TaxID=48074 RepID=A0A6P1TFT5_9GAMM|nr:M20/M25/M40 family metallo-hydrolase [Microbulbifer hydrolyticus]MBB5211888.1 acetylornithine deacetylase/succinyl-diaminopimelate desuccinylase-like protein [Microbulbifer hydrolyticus]QHQ40526.1 M20/M25/M40 family metallo-hydrolase [Microbulbifer hydrolyticus]
MLTQYLDELSNFIALETVAGNAQANRTAVIYLRERLLALGFDVQVQGAAQTDQPLLVARRGDTGAAPLVLYNHYDVERVRPQEEWQSPPFQLTQRDGRLWGRGIADNKAVLLARLAVIEACIARGDTLPDMLWLIQGEEEVGAPLAHQLFPALLAPLHNALCLEETGYYRDGVPLIFQQGDALCRDDGAPLVASLNQTLFEGRARVETHTLSKFGACPLIENLPAGSLYIGFGPNDYAARIHRDNESISLALLEEYFALFERFLAWSGDLALRADSPCAA